MAGCARRIWLSGASVTGCAEAASEARFAAQPGRDCPLCPRLVGFRAAQRTAFPTWHNAPVPSFGPIDAELLIVGLAPGLRGANRTGRPFTGDYAGELLYATMCRFGFAEGAYGARADDGLLLRNCRITNAVRCVPPENKPETGEVAACRRYLIDEIAAMTRLRVILALGSLAHGAVLRSFGEIAARRPFAHNAVHRLDDRPTLVDSYHCSRYNTNTGKLTSAMFEEVFSTARTLLDADSG